MADVFTYFEDLHKMPEIGMHEFKTSAYIADHLKKMGYEVQEHIGGGTGVVAVYDSGKPGPVLGLRADMDALGTKDGGAAHLCGHDGHMAMLLTAAEIIKEQKLVHKGKLKILFQPAEETSEGALSMLKGGAIDDIDILIGMHGRPIQECRVGQAAPALYYSAATHIRYDIIGKQSHGARPYLGVSALDAACLVVAAANALRFDSNVVYNLKATQIHADAGVPNAVPGNATVTFDLRSQSNDVMDLMIKKLTNAAKNAAASIGAEAVENILHSTPASIITPEVTNIIAEVIKEELGLQKQAFGGQGLPSPAAVAAGQQGGDTLRRALVQACFHQGPGQNTHHVIQVPIRRDGDVHPVPCPLHSAAGNGPHRVTMGGPAGA